MAQSPSSLSARATARALSAGTAMPAALPRASGAIRAAMGPSSAIPITGAPATIASSADMPNPSLPGVRGPSGRVSTATASAAESSRDASGTYGQSRTRSATPSTRASEVRRWRSRGRFGSSPPIAASVHSSPPGWASARIAVSMPLYGTNRPSITSSGPSASGRPDGAVSGAQGRPGPAAKISASAAAASPRGSGSAGRGGSITTVSARAAATATACAVATTRVDAFASHGASRWS